MIITAYRLQGFGKNSNVDLALDSTDLLMYLTSDMGDYITPKSKIIALENALRNIGISTTVHPEFNITVEPDKAIHTFVVGKELPCVVVRVI